MTKEQYNKYTEITKELEPIKEFLLWCGNKYKKVVYDYPFWICISKRIKGFVIRNKVSFAKWKHETELPKELQRRIVKVVEEYVEEREKELEEL